MTDPALPKHAVGDELHFIPGLPKESKVTVIEVMGRMDGEQLYKLQRMVGPYPDEFTTYESYLITQEQLNERLAASVSSKA